MARRRDKPQNLSAAELRVLDAFSCGRITAGSLSAELARARRERPVDEPIMLRRPAGAPALSRAA